MTHESVRACDQGAIRELWEKLPKRDSIYRQLDARSYENFYRLLQESCLIWVLPVGFIRVEYDRHTGAWVHGAFWSVDAVRDTEGLRGVMYDLMDALGVYELHIAIPMEMRGLAKFVEGLGAVWRGIAKNYYRINEHCHHAMVYDILDDREGVAHG